MYNDPPTAKASQYALLLPKPVQLLQEILPSLSGKAARPDAMHIDFFRLHTVNDLPGNELEFPWRNILFPGSPCEPVVSQAIAALGCMHRMQSKALPALSSSSNHSAEPYELYNKAVVGLRRYIDHAPEVGLIAASETTLTAVMLLFCFEVLSGNDHYALKHLAAAFKILAKTQGCQTNNTWAPGTLILGLSNAPRTDALVQLFLRLSSDWMVSGPCYHGGDTSLQAICRDPLPSQFQSIRDASIHLDTLCSDISGHEEFLMDRAEYVQTLQQEEHSNTTTHDCEHDCLIMATSRVQELDDQCAFQLGVHTTITALAQWRAAFAVLLSSQPQSNAVLLLEAQYLQAWLVIHTINDFDQTLCDSLEEDFRRVIDIAELYLLRNPTSIKETESVSCSLRSLSNLGNNLASAICFTVEKCRNSGIRQRGIKLLPAFDLRGIFDTPYLVSFYQHLVAVEEMRAREMYNAAPLDLNCSDVPQQARFLEAIMCYCDSQQEGEEFYRQSYGRMVYVVSDGQPGVLETRCSSFSVVRNAPSVAIA